MSPEELWALYEQSPAVLGPWSEASFTNTSGGGVSYGKEARWRLLPLVLQNYWSRGSDYGALVRKSRDLVEPERWDYAEMGGYDEDAYEEAMKDYAIEQRKWKPWHWEVRDRLVIPLGSWGYADTREEAMQAADAKLREHGVLLCGPSLK
jgi:hypothetical protein